jgi:cell division protein FtsI (penicillin-binding protein 3)
VKPGAIAAKIVPASLTSKEPAQPAPTTSATTAADPTARAGDLAGQKLPASGTVVLDVEEGGIEVPSFLGKNVRAALEAAQDAGLDLDAIGSGTAREQSPSPGAKVAAGSRVLVRFGR